MGQIIESLSTNAGYVLGGFYQYWVLSMVNWSTIWYILFAFVLVFVPLKLILRAKTKQYLPFVRSGLKHIGEGGCNIVLGGLGMAWVNLIVGLSPYFVTAPLTLVFVGLYFLLIMDVFWLKRTFRWSARLA
ncbi:MAG TPA: hypothetical protein VGS11_07570 [Candidatus Bathyarchaeia archaeon]|nr:hypothetical protein [Candidatus Bathyarchaeia archaeon]